MAPNITLTPFSTTLPATQGVPIAEAEQIFSTAHLRLKDNGGAVVPASFRVLSRWRGLPSDTSQPIKWVLVDAQPSSALAHTLDNSGAAQTLPNDLVVTDGASDIRVQTSALDVRLPKTGADLVSQWIQSGSERLAAGSKPRLTTPLTPFTTLVKHASANPAGPQAAPAGQDKIQVADASAFSVGQAIKIKWASKFASRTQTDIQLSGANYGTWYQTEPNAGNQPGTNPPREIIFARGTAREFTLTAFTYFYADSNQIHSDTNWPTPTYDALGLLLVDDTVEDAMLVPAANSEFTINAINGNEITLSGNLPVEVLVNGQVSLQSASPVTTPAQITQAVIEEQNAHRTVIKQSGFIGPNGSTQAIPDLTWTLRWYFYAGKGFARRRLSLANKTTDPNHAVQDILFSELKLSHPTAAAVTASDVEITTLSAATTRIVAGDIHEVTTEQAEAGTFKVMLAEFAEKFPQRLAAAGNEITWYVFPPLAGGATTRFWQDWQATWESFVGDVPAGAEQMISKPGFLPDPAYFCSSKAVRNALVPKQTWTAANFGGNADQAEAANRAEDMADCGYDLNACATQGEPGSVPRATLFEARLGSQLYPASTHNMGDHFGWDVYGNIKSDQDGYTFNRYDIPYVFLREFVRGGDARAFTLGSQLARYMADQGTFQSDEWQGGLALFNHKGQSRYERSSTLIAGLQTPRPSHSWTEGLALYWALTGDPIAYEAFVLHRNRAITYDFLGTGATGGHNDWLWGASPQGEARHAGWAALEAFVAYRYLGNVSDLNLVKQFLDHLRLSEESRGNHGFFHWDQNTAANPLQPYVWAGYPSVALFEYLREKRDVLATPDTALEAFIVRCADWIVRGDAQAGSVESDAPLVGGVPNGANYDPLAIRDFVEGAAYNYANAYVATLDICIVTLIAAARFGNRSDLRAIAEQAFRDVAFYRDTPNGTPVVPTSRTPINGNNILFRSTNWKVFGQTNLALSEFIPDAITSNPAPSITTINPSSVTEDGPDFTLTVNGDDFVSGAVVTVAGQDRATTFVSATQLTATVLAADLTSPGTRAIIVRNPDSQTSNSVNLTVTSGGASAPAPGISSLNPSSATAGGAAFVLTVNGADFVSGAVVKWNGSPRTTTFVSPTQLTAQITQADIASAGNKTVIVTNPDIQDSNPVTFTVNAAQSGGSSSPTGPAISALSPALIAEDSAQFVLTVTGVRFSANSVVRWNGADLVTTYVSATELTAVVPSANVVDKGDAAVVVHTPSGVNQGTSQHATFRVVAGAGSITSLSPNTIASGSAAFTLTVNGAGFSQNTKVVFDGGEKTTTYVSPSQLRAQISATDVASAHTATVKVRT